MSELKNCPFTLCNGEAEIIPEGDYHEARCIECGVMVQAHTYEECLNLWNTRTASPRFTEGEREAMEYVTNELEYLQSRGRFPNNATISNAMIATVRKMLEGSV